MKVIDRYWLSNYRGTIGIILVEDEHTFERRVYCGSADGQNEEIDTASKVQMGSKLSMEVLQKIVQQLRTPKTKRGKAEPVKC